MHPGGALQKNKEKIMNMKMLVLILFAVIYLIAIFRKMFSGGYHSINED